MQVLGVDYGTKRIGLATGDAELTMAFPLRTVPNGPDAVAAVAKAAAEIGAERIVVGAPTRLAGSDAPAGETELLADRFVEELGAATRLPVDREDERMTSVIAERRRLEAGAKRADFDIDAEAAAVMLEGYLERRSHADVS